MSICYQILLELLQVEIGYNFVPDATRRCNCFPKHTNAWSTLPSVQSFIGHNTHIYRRETK